MTQSLPNVGNGWEFCHLPQSEFPKAGKGKCWNLITGCPRLEKRDIIIKNQYHGFVVCGCRTPDGQIYCYMANLCERFPNVHSPKYCYHNDRYSQPIGTRKPSLVAVGTAGDMWSWWEEGDQNPEYGADIHNLWSMINTIPHFYLFLTKNPDKYKLFSNFIENLTNIGIGATVTGINDISRIDDLRAIKNVMRFVVIEPCFFTPEEADLLDFSGIDWVIVGALNGKGAKKWKPSFDTLVTIDQKASKANSALYFKESLMPILQEEVDNLNNLECDYVKNCMPKQFPQQIHKWSEKHGNC